MLRQCVEKGIRGGVVRLSRRADQAENRREKDKMVEFVVEGCVVEQPTSLNLGGGNCGKPVRIHLIEDSVVEHPGAMKDTPQGGHLRPDLAQDPLELSLFCDVADSDDRADPFPLKSPNGLQRLVPGWTAAGENKLADTAFRHPLGHLQTER